MGFLKKINLIKDQAEYLGELNKMNYLNPSERVTGKFCSLYVDISKVTRSLSLMLHKR